MVGRRNPKSLLQCNTYLRCFEEGSGPRRVCIDPGSQFDFSVIEGNISQLIGGLAEVDGFTLNHQDPDVVGNSAYFCGANPRIQVTVTEDVWRLVQHLLLRPGEVHFANPALSASPHSPGGRWRLVPTPFCHFRGAMALYDAELRTLFSGDLFGGFNALDRVHLYAEAADWLGVMQFHQIYMPTREALRYAVRQIRALSPPVEIIAPQHGHIVTGDLVPLFLERMYDLPVGHDLLAFELDQHYLPGYREALAELLERAEELLGRQETFARLISPDFRDELGRQVQILADDVILEQEGYSALVKVLARLTYGESLEFANTLRTLVLNACVARGLPIPPIGAGIELPATEGGGPTG